MITIKNKIHLSEIINGYTHYLIFLFISILVLIESPLSPITGGQLNFDSGVYIYTGFRMSKGYLPYLETWDNKGLVMYLINMVGILINYNYGVWFIEVVSLFISAIFMYKTFIIFASKTISIISVVYVLIAIGGLLWGGNYTEEFALPYSFIAIYIFSKSIISNENLNKLQSILLGVTFAITLLLRPNIAVVWPAFFLVYFLNLLNKKKYLISFKNLLFFILGISLTLIPVIYYLLINDIFFEFIEATLIIPLGFEKPSLQQRMDAIKNILYTLNFYSGTIIISLASLIGATYYICIKRSISEGLKLIYYAIIIAFFANIHANSLSGYPYVHYILTFIPILSIPIIIFVNFSENLIRTRKINVNKIHKHFSVIYISLILLLLVLTSIKIQYLQYNNNKNSQNNNIISYIISNSSEDDEIQNFSDYTDLYYKTRRQAASRFFYVLTNGVLSDDYEKLMLETIYDDIIQNPPKLIILSKEYEEYINNIKINKSYSYRDFLKYNYILENTINDVKIFHRLNEMR